MNQGTLFAGIDAPFLGVHNYVIGGLADMAWTACYLTAIYAAYKSKKPAFPLVAIAAMWSYEAMFALVFPFESPLFHAFELSWFVFDTVLLVQTFVWARKLMPEEEWARYARAWAAIVTVLALGGTIGWVAFFQQTNGMLPALIAQGIIAVLFPAFILRGRGAVTGWTLGTRVAADALTAINVVLMPWAAVFATGNGTSLNDPFVQWLLAATLIADLASVSIFVRQSQASPIPAVSPA